jgi:hypothetical protein
VGFKLAIFFATFGGLIVLAAAGFSVVERLIIMVVIALIYGTVMGVLSGRPRHH